jgi:predicted anti-sigma-YlaC factor YlaD
VTCRAARSLLEELVDGELEPEQAHEVRAHLHACAECRGEYEQAASLPLRLRALPSPQPPDLAPAVMCAVAARRPRLGWARRVAQLVVALAIAGYVSGVRGLARLGADVGGDLGALMGWSSGSTSLPAPASVDVLLLLGFIALMGLAAWHLALLARQAPRLARSR